MDDRIYIFYFIQLRDRLEINSAAVNGIIAYLLEAYNYGHINRNILHLRIKENIVSELQKES